MSRRLFLSLSLPIIGNPLDKPEQKLQNADENDLGWDRLMRVLQPDEFGGLSEEVETVLQVGCMSMFVGAMYGGVIQSRTAYMDFFKNNQATVFKDHLEAKKRLQDNVTKAFGRGAFRWGWRLTFFSTTYVRMSRRLFLSLSLPIIGNPLDKPEQKLQNADENDLGWDRLMRVLQPDEFGGLSEEVETVLQVGCMSMFVGAMYGGVIQSRTAYMDFFKNNQATVFKDHLEAKKRLQDNVTKAFGRGAFRWGWRLTFFSTTYVAVSTVSSVYRNKHGILDYIAGGVATGIAYKFNMGPRGWLVGGGLGCLLGIVAGGSTLGILKLAGISMEDTRRYNSQWRKKRTDETSKGIKQHLEKEEMELLLEHNRKIEASVKEKMARQGVSS